MFFWIETGQAGIALLPFWTLFWTKIPLVTGIFSRSILCYRKYTFSMLCLEASWPIYSLRFPSCSHLPWHFNRNSHCELLFCSFLSLPVQDLHCKLYGGLIYVTFCLSVVCLSGLDGNRRKWFLTTLWEKFMSANWHGIFALIGRAHCQRQVAFFGATRQFSSTHNSCQARKPILITLNTEALVQCGKTTSLKPFDCPHVYVIAISGAPEIHCWPLFPGRKCLSRSVMD